MSDGKVYALEYKIQAVKFANEIGQAKVTAELGIPKSTMHTWIRMVRSMNSDGGRCHDNARCESMWTCMKSELFYGRYDTKKFTKAELKVKIWRYFMSYWNNRRICSTNGGLPPMVKRRKYYNYIIIMKK